MQIRSSIVTDFSLLGNNFIDNLKTGKDVYYKSDTGRNLLAIDWII